MLVISSMASFFTALAIMAALERNISLSHGWFGSEQGIIIVSIVRQPNHGWRQQQKECQIQRHL
jgi:hypothetical protein